MLNFLCKPKIFTGYSQSVHNYTERSYTMSTNKEKASWLASLLTGWGVKESWAKIIAGAVIGALLAAGVLTSTGCTTAYTQTAAGDISFRGVIVLPDGK